MSALLGNVPKRLGVIAVLGALIALAGCGGSGGGGNGDGNGTPTDTTPPQISNCSVEPTWSRTGPFTISASVTDDVAVREVYAIVTPLDGLTSSSGVWMAHVGGTTYAGQFEPTNTTREQTFRVSIHASDAAGNASTCESQLGCILAPVPDAPF